MAAGSRPLPPSHTRLASSTIKWNPPFSRFSPSRALRAAPPLPPSPSLRVGRPHRPLPERCPPCAALRAAAPLPPAALLRGDAEALLRAARWRAAIDHLPPPRGQRAAALPSSSAAPTSTPLARFARDRAARAPPSLSPAPSPPSSSRSSLAPPPPGIAAEGRRLASLCPNLRVHRRCLARFAADARRRRLASAALPSPWALLRRVLAAHLRSCCRLPRRLAPAVAAAPSRCPVACGVRPPPSRLARPRVSLRSLQPRCRLRPRPPPSLVPPRSLIQDRRRSSPASRRAARAVASAAAWW